MQPAAKSQSGTVFAITFNLIMSIISMDFME